MCLLTALATSYHIRDSHDFWYNAARKTASSGVPYADVAWNYCDYKCITLETIYPSIDFYVINFKDAIYKPNFSACYAKTPGGTPQLWNKVAQNSWYQENCGDDKEDYLQNPDYTQESQEGTGIGTPINYN